MAKYLLDSDILIYFLKGRGETVVNVAKHSPEDLLTSRINYTELLYGAYNSAKVESNLKVILPFLDNFEILECGQSASEIFAKEKARLKKSGNMLADMDLMIASIAIANDMILVTNNTRHFDRIKNLKLENWLE
jgi:predicted nucleic acid-binding protein